MSMVERGFIVMAAISFIALVGLLSLTFR